MVQILWHKKQKRTKAQKTYWAFFFTKLQKTGNGNICVLCHKFWTNQDLDMLSISNWPSEPEFCERWTYIWQKNEWRERVVKLSFLSNIHFRSVFDKNIQYQINFKCGFHSNFSQFSLHTSELGFYSNVDSNGECSLIQPRWYYKCIFTILCKVFFKCQIKIATFHCLFLLSLAASPISCRDSQW